MSFFVVDSIFGVDDVDEDRLGQDTWSEFDDEVGIV